MNKETMDKLISDFTDFVMKKAKIKEYKIRDYDLSRVYLDVEDGIDNYTIRMWQLVEGAIRYSLFRQEGNHGVSVIESEVYIFDVENYLVS